MLRTLVIALLLVACGGNGGSNDKVDAPASGDGPMIDAPAGDGMMPTVDAAILAGPTCGATTCTLGTQDCCIGLAFVCRPTGTCPSQGFSCDGPEDCPNAVCCYPNQNNGSRCQANNCQAIACHQDADCPAGTPKCCSKPFTPFYNVCQAQC